MPLKANRNHKKLTAYSVYTSGLSVLCTEIARQGCLRAHMAVFAMLLHSRIAPVNTIFARLYFAGIFEVRLYRFSSRSASINSVFCADFSSFFLTTRAGTPATTIPDATSSMTTDPAATTEPSPIRTPSITTALAPMSTLSSIDYRALQKAAPPRLPAQRRHRCGIVSHHCPAAQHRAHINHGTFSDYRADIDNRSHHNYCIVADLYLLADNSSRFNPGMDILFVQQGNCRVSGIVLHLLG